MASNGQMIRDNKGRFVKGVSGNTLGRPVGSKNVITVQKLLVEEAFRGAEKDDISKVLALIVQKALQGDKASQKLIWDSSVSKQAIEADKAAGKKQEIKVHTMNVGRGVDIEGEYDVVKPTQPEEVLN